MTFTTRLGSAGGLLSPGSVLEMNPAHEDQEAVRRNSVVFRKMLR